MMRRISFGDGRGGGYRIELAADGQDGDIMESVTVLHKSGGPNTQWNEKFAGKVRVELLSDDYRTLY